MLNLKPSSIWKPVWVSTQLLKDHIFQGVRNGVSDIIYHSGYTLRPKHVTGWAASRKKQISQLHGSVNFCRGHSKTSIKLTEKKRTNINVESDGYLKPKGADICHLWAEFKNSKKQKQKTNLPSGILPKSKTRRCVSWYHADFEALTQNQQKKLYTRIAGSVADMFVCF